MGFDVFISYASKDKLAADAACAALEASHVRCWIAPRDVLPGADWGASIIDALDQCRAVVLIFSANANDSAQIRNEIVHAVQRGVPLIPVRIEDIQPAKSLAYYMGSVHWLDALSPPLEMHVKRLAESVKALLKLDGPQPDTSPVQAPAVPSARPAEPVPDPAASSRPPRSPAVWALAGSCLTLLIVVGGFWYFQPDWKNLLAMRPPPASGKAEPLPAQPAAVAAQSPSAPPAAPARQAAAAPASELPMSALLMARFVALTPTISQSTRERVTREYAEAKNHKAQAVSLQPPGIWRASGRDSAQLAEEAALENCQISFGQPCVLIAVNNVLTPTPDGESGPRRDMPRVRYAGSFDLNQLPGVAHLKQRADIAGYAAAAEPKAIAIHPASQMFTVTGATTQRAAEERVLDICSKDQSRPNGLGPCYLYAVRNQVVLPQRSTKPLTTN